MYPLLAFDSDGYDCGDIDIRYFLFQFVKISEYIVHL